MSVLAEHVIDRDGLVWRVVRDGGMATRADYTGIVSIGMETLRREHGPLVNIAEQTSRTNIIEALRLFENADDAIRWLIADHSKEELADLIVAALAAEPRSDAVTAPDEPSTEWGRKPWPTLTDEHGFVREARAASASVPPLDFDTIFALTNGHESDCVYYEGGDLHCSCGYDAALDRASKWLDANEPKEERDASR